MPSPSTPRPQTAATCYGGRNRLVAKEYVAAVQAGKPESFGELEVRRGRAANAGGGRAGRAPWVPAGRPTLLAPPGGHQCFPQALPCQCVGVGLQRPSAANPPLPPRPPAAQARLLGGQKLQGVLTSDEVQAILQRRGWERDYPLFTTGGLGAARRGPQQAQCAL